MNTIFLILTIAAVVASYFLWKRRKTKQEASTQMIRSEFFPDHLYVGKLCKLDATLKYIFTSVMFAFPDNSLMVKSFNTFTLLGNKFEETVFDRMAGKQYILLHDSFEKNTYFLNLLMSKHHESTVISEDTVTLEEGDLSYDYADMSGLHEVTLSSGGSRLIRAYSRDATDTDKEYLILMQDNSGVTEFYVGFTLNISQLTQL